MIKVESSQPGRRVTVSELKASGLLPELSDQQQQEQKQTSKDYSNWRIWPDYEKCLAAKPTRSEADAQFTWISLKRGFTPDEIMIKLDEVSEKARESGIRYIKRTVRKEIRYIENTSLTIA